MSTKSAIRTKEILDEIGKEVLEAGDSYLNISIKGLNKVSVNAHELNTLIALLGQDGGFNTTSVHKKIIITCARLIEVFEENNRIAEEMNKKQLESKILKEEMRSKTLAKEADINAGNTTRKKRTTRKKIPSE